MSNTDKSKGLWALNPKERKVVVQVEDRPAIELSMDEYDPLLAAYNDGDGNQRAQHSPLPWQVINGAVCDADGQRAYKPNIANAKLIVASVNHYPAMLAICKEIANCGCDLGDSERRIRLYSALEKAGEL